MHFTPTQQRLTTGFGLLVALALFITLGGWPLRLAVALVAALSMHEFLELYWPGRVYIGRKVLGIALAMLIVLSQALDPLCILAVLCLAAAAVFLVFLFDYGNGNTEAKLGHYSPLLHGFLYIPLVLQLALYLSPAEQCLVMIAAIATDTGGYYVGTRFGRHKIWTLVSPKKSWEGLFGGLALCLVAIPLLGLIGQAMEWNMLRLPAWGWLLTALILNLAALLGDFFESALKRSLNIKDSGTLLPGHGGLLDRLDSLLFALPVFMIIRLAANLLQGA
ncbi:phosphatidate cytidylyltransferase [Desulfovibrio sp. OttesenSCG-928-M14]|nr:phosphatidate cytidylyltransferase [Desulfovibrio sp. OttesenSCG-928-M16]MDL2216325.1 phosphatidate cytidylyltransferase [Desulfovibrio sp. OttesenSCG-928-M14]